MSIMPQFSVVVPLYNKKLSLERCIASVLQQEFVDFELIIVDDGSTDGSGGIIRCIDDSRLQVVEQKNAGPAAARNHGVRLARASYVCFLDADDEWHAGYLGAMNILLQKAPDAVLLSAAHSVVGEDGNIFIRRMQLPSQYLGYVRDFFRLYESFELVNSSTACVRKSALLAIGGFPEVARVGEDIYTWLRLADSGPVAFANIDLVSVFRDAENRSGNRPEFRMPYHTEMVLGRGGREFSSENRDKVVRFVVRNAVVQAAAAALLGQRSASVLLAKRLLKYSVLASVAALGAALTPSSILEWVKRRRNNQ